MVPHQHIGPGWRVAPARDPLVDDVVCIPQIITVVQHSSADLLLAKKRSLRPCLRRSVCQARMAVVMTLQDLTRHPPGTNHEPVATTISGQTEQRTHPVDCYLNLQSLNVPL